MKKIHILPLVLGMLMTWSTTSCSSSDNPSDVVATKDCAITAVTLGTLHRRVDTKSVNTGNDTTYYVNVTGSLYPMYIDQVNNRIYNADSLPLNTQVDKVVFSTLRGSGSITIQSLSTGRDTLFVSTDSTDFSRLRQVKVYSSDGTLTRTYDFEVNVHKEEADSFVWKQMTAGTGSLVASFVENRLLCEGRVLYVFGKTAQGTYALAKASSADAQFDTWNNLVLPAGTNFDVSSVRRFASAFYALGNGCLLYSADGITWTKVGEKHDLQALAAASADSLYAIAAGGQVVSTADGTDWTAQQMDTDGQAPTSNVASTICPSHTDSHISTMLMLGDEAEGTAVWKHDIDSQSNYIFPWIYLPQTEELRGQGCPTLKHPSLMEYDGGAMLIGLTSTGEASSFYQSADLGRTWKVAPYTMPSISTPACISAAVDAEHNVWVVCGGTGEVWRGRLNRLAWENNKQVILKNRRK